MSFFVRWLPVMAWSAVILVASGGEFSAARSGSWFRALFGFELPYVLHVLARKLAHLVVYGILGALAWRAARVDTSRPAAVALTIALAVAVADETRQSTDVTRTGTAWDVALDMIGAWIAVRISQARRRREQDVEVLPD